MKVKILVAVAVTSLMTHFAYAAPTENVEAPATVNPSKSEVAPNVAASPLPEMAANNTSVMDEPSADTATGDDSDY